MMNRTKIYNTPIKIGLLYSLATILLYEFGPYAYPNHNKFILYGFLLASNFAMWLGFRSGASKRITQPTSYARTLRIDSVLNILFWISLIICVPKFMMATGIYNNVISNIILRVTTYSEMAREFYMDRQELQSVTGIWKVVNIFTVILGPFFWAYLSLSMLFWGRLSLFKKLFTLFIYIINVGQYLCTGTNVGVFNFLIFIGVVFVIRKRVYDGKSYFQESKTKKNNLIYIIISAVVIIAFLGFFNITMESRVGEIYGMESDSDVCNRACPVDNNSFLYRITPESLCPLLLTTTSYVAKPYAALSFAFDMPFRSTLGVGYSWFLMDNVPNSRFFWERSYPMQLERTFNYSSWVNWHTAYTWFANDVSWLGVPFVLFVLFLVFGKSWKRFIVTGDILSFLMFMLFVRFVLFVSMNNQVFQQSDTLLAFWIIIISRSLSKPIRWV